MFWTVLARLAGAAAAVAVGLVLANLLAGVAGDEARRRGVDPELKHQAVGALELALRLVVGIAALAILGVPPAPLVVLLVVGAGLSAYVGRDALADVAAGATLLQTRPFRPGDRVRIGDVEGTVTSAGWLAVELAADGARVFLPNHLVARQVIRVLPATAA